MTPQEAIKILKGAIKKPNTKDGYLGQAIDMAIKALEQTRWIPVSERLPEDGTWNIWQSTTGAISVERYKEDAYDHFYPSRGIFSLEDAVAWMPLPERYKTEEDEEWPTKKQ